MFRGSMTALVTPLKDNQVDVERLRKLVNFHIESGTNGLVAAGTTGESGTLSLKEKLLVIKTVVEEAAERIPVIAGTACNATQDCIELTRQAMECGVDAVLVMTPAYIKPTQEGLFLHYSHIAKEIAVPVILYNVPGRTGVDLEPQTVEKLAHISNIIGIKEAVSTTERLNQLLNAAKGTIDIFSGDDPTACEWMLSGAKGVISVSANVVPREMAKMCDAGLDGDIKTCREIHETLAPLHHLLFVESNPIPVKWALARMHLIEGELRLPLTTLSTMHQNAMEAVLKQLNLI